MRAQEFIIESVHAYHGTFQPTINKFNALSHFGTLQAAEDRLKEKARREKIRTPGRVYEVVLDIKNPFIAKDFAGVHSPTHFVFDLKSKKLISQEELEAINKHMGTPRQAELLIKKLRELGFDSIAYKNKYEDKGSTSYVILDPAQVVSVRPLKQKEAVTEAHIPDEIEDFLYDLQPDDVGVEEFGHYRVHYEGFTDDCQSSSDYCANPEAVYQQVFADHIAREGGRRPIEQNFTGDEDYPILYSIFKVVPIKENFADKKVKGKSRPGRVKRAGASCAGSVTSLRAKAKKSGGERGKMYHWCANMKAGRKNESIAEAELQRGTITIKIDDHAIKRVNERNIDPHAVDRVLDTLTSIKPKFQEFESGEQFWVHSNQEDISLGFTMINPERRYIKLKTAIVGRTYGNRIPTIETR